MAMGPTQTAAPGLDSILRALQEGPQPQGNSGNSVAPLMQGSSQHAAFLRSLRNQNPELAQALATPMGQLMGGSQSGGLV